MKRVLSIFFVFTIIISLSVFGNIRTESIVAGTVKMTKHDEYRYIINRLNLRDTLPLGAGAGGSFKSGMVMNLVSFEQYKDSVENFDNRRLMIFNQDYFELEALKSSIQLGKIPLNSALLQNAQSYLKDLKNNGFMTEDGCLTSKGFYWAFNIAKSLLEFIKK